MLQLRKERLARLGKLGQMAWRYHALKTRPKRLEACMRLRRLVNKYKLTQSGWPVLPEFGRGAGSLTDY